MREATTKTYGWALLGLLLLVGPWFLGTFHLYTLNLILVNIILATGFNLLTGNAGQVSLCSASFMAIGAYSVALLNLRLGLSYWLALPMGGFVAAGLGFALGFPALRVRGYYLGLTTLGFLEITQTIIQEFPGLTGGVRGMMVPRPTFASIKLTTDISFYYPIMAITAFMLYGAWNLVHSPLGRAFDAIRNSEPAAQALGISPSRSQGFGLYSIGFLCRLGRGTLCALSRVHRSGRVWHVDLHFSNDNHHRRRPWFYHRVYHRSSGHYGFT